MAFEFRLKEILSRPSKARRTFQILSEMSRRTRPLLSEAFRPLPLLWNGTKTPPALAFPHKTPAISLSKMSCSSLINLGMEFGCPWRTGDLVGQWRRGEVLLLNDAPNPLITQGIFSTLTFSRLFGSPCKRLPICSGLFTRTCAHSSRVCHLRGNPYRPLGSNQYTEWRNSTLVNIHARPQISRAPVR